MSSFLPPPASSLPPQPNGGADRNQPLPQTPSPVAQTPAPPVPAPEVLPRLDPGDALDPTLRSNPRFQVRQLRSPSAEFDRLILIYLPEAYAAEPDRRFPVFYLHDGQNLFDGETSYLPGHTWRAGTTADMLAAADRIEPVILVGIANLGIGRMNEYTPTPDPKLGGGGGDRYGQFLLDELKPLIDAGWRTRPGPNDTGLGGSSLGGLISLYLALKHRDIFARIAVLSPSIWWDRRSIFGLVRHASTVPELRIWLDMGTAEGARHLHDADQLYGLLLERGWEVDRELVYQRVAGGIHHEDAWADRFGDVLTFLFPLRATAVPEATTFDVTNADTSRHLVSTIHVVAADAHDS